LATFRKDGRQVNTPVWVVGLDQRLYVNTERESAKVRRIRNNPRVKLAPCTMSGKVTGDWRDGTARQIDDAVTVGKVNALIRAKYGFQVTVLQRVFALFSARARNRVTLEVQLSS
jgi:PPOX class probable F420-dependent enzyme